MDHSHIERLAGCEPGSYVRDPEATYLTMQRAISTCLLDQWIPRNPLEIGPQGYIGHTLSATTGAVEVVVDGIRIDSPEAVVTHMERYLMPEISAQIQRFDHDARVRHIIDQENATQAMLGEDILKSGYGFISFPTLEYYSYGYVPYFSAFALYPEVMERCFALQADLAVLNNRAALAAYRQANLPPRPRHGRFARHVAAPERTGAHLAAASGAQSRRAGPCRHPPDLAL
ncbi:MAG: hypothetical protein GXY52_00215 [Chloroflexi bacterium]|nr:hypothetical protein [Chloroflexota bacterium]